MRSYWQFWGGYFGKETCDQIISDAQTLQSIEASTYSNLNDLRKSRVRWINRGEPKWNWLFLHLENIFRRANSAFGFDLNYFHEIQFTEYDSSYGGHYSWHEDLLWIPKNDSSIQRKLSLVLQLTPSENYSGGDFEMDIPHSKPDPLHLRTVGSAMVFPSFVKHRVTPVTSGIRHSLVTWYEGPCFK